MPSFGAGVFLDLRQKLRNPLFLWKITPDYHWLELQIAQENSRRTAEPAKADDEIDPIFAACPCLL